MGCAGAKGQKMLTVNKGNQIDKINENASIEEECDNGTGDYQKKEITFDSEKKRHSIGRSFIKHLKSYSVHLDGRVGSRRSQINVGDNTIDSSRLKKVHSQNSAVNAFDSENLSNTHNQEPSFASLTLKGALEIARIAFYGGATPNIIQSSKNGLYEVYIYNDNEKSFKISSDNFKEDEFKHTNGMSKSLTEFENVKESFTLSHIHENNAESNISTQTLSSAISMGCELCLSTAKSRSPGENSDVTEDFDKQLNDVNQQNDKISEKADSEENNEVKCKQSQQSIVCEDIIKANDILIQSDDEAGILAIHHRGRHKSLRIKLANLLFHRNQRMQSNRLSKSRNHINDFSKLSTRQGPLMLSTIITEHDTLLYDRMLMYYHYNNQLINKTRYTPIPMEFEYLD